MLDYGQVKVDERGRTWRRPTRRIRRRTRRTISRRRTRRSDFSTNDDQAAWGPAPRRLSFARALGVSRYRDPADRGTPTGQARTRHLARLRPRHRAPLVNSCHLAHRQPRPGAPQDIDVWRSPTTAAFENATGDRALTRGAPAHSACPPAARAYQHCRIRRKPCIAAGNSPFSVHSLQSAPRSRLSSPRLRPEIHPACPHRLRPRCTGRSRREDKLKEMGRKPKTPTGAEADRAS